MKARRCRANRLLHEARDLLAVRRKELPNVDPWVTFNQKTARYLLGMGALISRLEFFAHALREETKSHTVYGFRVLQARGNRYRLIEDGVELYPPMSAEALFDVVRSTKLSDVLVEADRLRERARDEEEARPRKLSARHHSAPRPFRKQ